MKVKPDAQEQRWVVALEALQQQNDAREVIRLVLNAKPPDWVREELMLWLAGELPPDPALSADDWHLLQAAREYRRRSDWLEREKRVHRIARIAAEYSKAAEVEVPARTLQSVLDFEGRAYLRIKEYFNEVSRRDGVTSDKRKDPSI